MPSSITLDQPDPHYSDPVTFTVETNRTDTPWVHVQCIQDGSLVFEQWADYSAGKKEIRLGPTQLWAGGPASGTAVLVEFSRNGSPRTIANTSFPVKG